MISAFGVEDPRISKAMGDWRDAAQKPTRAGPPVKRKLADIPDGTIPDPGGKKYVPGTITLHHEQAQLHSRKKAAADRRVGLGTSIIGVGSAGGALVAGNARRIARTITPAARDVGTRTHEVQLARNAHRIRLGGAGAGLAVAGGGAALAAEGVASRIRHGRAQNKSAQAAQAARRARAADRDWSA